MAGGAVMALALASMRRVGFIRRLNNELDRIPLVGAATTNLPEPEDHLGKRVLTSALLGGAYGAIRSGLQLPGILSAPVFGLVAMGLSRAGIGPEAKGTPGPWDGQSKGLIPELVTHTVYGTVTDQVSTRVEDILA